MQAGVIFQVRRAVKPFVLSAHIRGNHIAWGDE